MSSSNRQIVGFIILCKANSGFRNVRIQQFIISFSRHPCHPNPIFEFIYSATSQKSNCLIISSLDLSVSEYQSIRPTIFAILQQLIIDRLPKKFAQPIHPSTALPLPLQFAVNANRPT